MNDDVSYDITKRLGICSEFWVSGMYVLDEALVPALIVVETNPDVWQASVYVYSYLGLGPSHFFLHERVVWLKHAEMVQMFRLVDETELELQESVPVLPDGESVDMWEFDWCKPRGIADLLCPHLTKLHQFGDVDTTWEDLAEGDEDFEVENADIIARETPDFWP